MKLGTLYGVGVGPGDPSQLTLRAVSVIQNSKAIFAPVLDLETEGRAESIVKKRLPEVEINRLLIYMDSRASSSYEQASTHVIASLKNGNDTTLITLGDPNLYSTFTKFKEIVKVQLPGLKVVTIPGITAFQVLASLSDIDLALETNKIHLMPALNNLHDIEIALEDKDATTIVYKVGDRLGSIKNTAQRLGRLDKAILGESIGLENERIGYLKDFNETTYLATIIFPKES